MSNPQAPGKQRRKDARSKGPQSHHGGAPGRGEHQSGQSTRPSHEQSHGQNRPAPSHSPQSMEDE
jgi:hypothetical protein